MSIIRACKNTTLCLTPIPCICVLWSSCRDEDGWRNTATLWSVLHPTCHWFWQTLLGSSVRICENDCQGEIPPKYNGLQFKVQSSEFHRVGLILKSRLFYFTATVFCLVSLERTCSFGVLCGGFKKSHIEVYNTKVRWVKMQIKLIKVKVTLTFMTFDLGEQVWCTWCWSPILKVRCLTSHWFLSASATTEFWRSPCFPMSYWVSPSPKRAPQYVAAAGSPPVLANVIVIAPKIWGVFTNVTSTHTSNSQRVCWTLSPLSLQGLLKASSVLQDSYGAMHVNFGHPLSVRELLKGKINRCQYNFVPRSKGSLSNYIKYKLKMI